MKRLTLALPLLFALGLTFAVLLLLGHAAEPPAARAADAPHPASAPSDILCVALEGGAYPGCTQVFTNVQAAVDAAAEGEVIKVAAGVYTGCQPTPA